MIQKRNVEFWVGIFIFIGLFILGYMIIRLGSYDKLTKNSYDIIVSFKFTNGVIEGAPVRVAGVESGKVKKLILTPDAERKVDVVISLDSAVQLRQNVRAVVNSLGIMGEKYIEFLPQDTSAPILNPGARIEGEEPMSIADLTSSARELVQSLEGVFKDGKSGNKLKTILDNVVILTGEENQKNLSLTLTNLNEFSGKLNRFSTDLEKISDDETFSETFKNFHEASESLKSVLEQIKSGEGTVGKLVYDQDLYDKLKLFLKDIMENPSRLFRPSKDKEKGSGSFLFFNKK